MGKYALKRLMRKLTPLRRAQGVLAVLALVAFITPREVEKYGDQFQVALPLLALGCQIANGQGLAYFGRYAVHFVGLHATKRGLGDAEIAHQAEVANIDSLVAGWEEASRRALPTTHTVWEPLEPLELRADRVPAVPVGRRTCTPNTRFTKRTAKRHSRHDSSLTCRPARAWAAGAARAPRQPPPRRRGACR
jgi:hypothetical protein